MLKGTQLLLFLRLNSGLIKVLGLFVSTCLLLHLAACVFCALPGLETDPTENWINRYS